VSPSNLVVKKDEVVETPSHLGSCISPPVEKGEDLRVRSDRVSEVVGWFWSVWGGYCVGSGR
jgi:hypothetical protein